MDRRLFEASGQISLDDGFLAKNVRTSIFFLQSLHSKRELQDSEDNKGVAASSIRMPGSGTGSPSAWQLCEFIGDQRQLAK